ncbi:MAG: FGGY family carbohydrate kinase [Phycisphaerales bacterium]
MLFCGIDLGTTNTKAVIVDEDLRMLDKITISLPLIGDRCTSDANVWQSHFCRIIEYFGSRGLINKSNKVACCISAQGGTFILLDDKYRAVAPACSWRERSNQTMVQGLANHCNAQSYYTSTGWYPSISSMACKLKQMMESNSDITNQFSYVSSIPEFIHSQIAGEFITDITTAQMTGIADINTCSWDKKVLEWLHLKEVNFAKISYHPELISEDISVAGNLISLTTSIHDQYAAMYAAGLASDDSIMLGTGTAWVISGKSTQLLYDENISIHPGRDLWPNSYGYIIGLGPIGKEFDILCKKLMLSSNDIERICLELTHSSNLDYDIVIGLMEPSQDMAMTNKKICLEQYMLKVAARVAVFLKKLQKHESVNKIIMTGGAAHNVYIPRIIANLANLPVEVMHFNEFSAYGAALFAMGAVSGQPVRHKPKWMKSVLYEPGSSAVKLEQRNINVV